MKALQDSLSNIPRWVKLFGWLVVIIIFIGAIFSAATEFRKEASDFYTPGKIIEIETGTEHRARLIINEPVRTGWFFGANQLFLKGTLLVSKPEGARYEGVAEGSLALNWSHPDGGGETWYFVNLNPTDDYKISNVLFYEITVDEIITE